MHAEAPDISARPKAHQMQSKISSTASQRVLRFLSILDNILRRNRRKHVYHFGDEGSLTQGKAVTRYRSA